MLTGCRSLVVASPVVARFAHHLDVERSIMVFAGEVRVELLHCFTGFPVHTVHVISLSITDSHVFRNNQRHHRFDKVLASNGTIRVSQCL